MSGVIEKPYKGALIGKEHHFALRVYIEDTDLGGVVYHANYVRFLERARSDLLQALGISQRAALEMGHGIYAVVEMRIKFCRPAKLEDELVIVSQLESLRGATCVIRQKILRDQEIMVQAVVTVAFLSPEGRPRRQPAEWVEKLETLRAEDL